MTDNVRKIFDMLGVEPNERFKVEGLERKIFIDEYLYIKDEEGKPYSAALRTILTGQCEIIKLPKEPKKIGNLKCGDVEDCEDCPFKVIDCGEADDLKIHTYTLFDILNNWYEKYKDQEIYKILKARLDKEVLE